MFDFCMEPPYVARPSRGGPPSQSSERPLKVGREDPLTGDENRILEAEFRAGWDCHLYFSHGSARVLDFSRCGFRRFSNRPRSIAVGALPEDDLYSQSQHGLAVRQHLA